MRLFIIAAMAVIILSGFLVEGSSNSIVAQRRYQSYVTEKKYVYSL
jgi:hypothetical protein